MKLIPKGSTSSQRSNLTADMFGGDNLPAPLSESRFSEFWEAYPSRSPHANPRKPAESAYKSAVRRGAVEQDIIDGAAAYAGYCLNEITDRQFIAQATTFLNQERWSQLSGYDPTRGKSGPPGVGDVLDRMDEILKERS